MKRIPWFVVLIWSVALGQETTAFEVSSLKIAKVGAPHPNGISGNRFSLGPMPLEALLMYAYNVRPYQLFGAPASVGSENYVIDAKAPGEGVLGLDRARIMLQTLLAERFQLKLHRETRDASVYRLTVGKGGARLKESTAEASGLRITLSHIEARKISMTVLANLLSIQMDRPVLDRTGLAGNYELDLKFLPLADLPPDAPDYQFAMKEGAPSLFTAVQEQLGLRLDATREPIEVLVIDHWERPSEN